MYRPTVCTAQYECAVVSSSVVRCLMPFCTVPDDFEPFLDVTAVDKSQVTSTSHSTARVYRQRRPGMRPQEHIPLGASHPDEFASYMCPANCCVTV